MTKDVSIKTFGNGDVLTCSPSRFGGENFKINGAPAFFQPLITPRKHPSGALLVAIVECRGQKYALTQETNDAIQALAAQYEPTLIDRMSTIWQLEDVVKARRSELGSARAAAIEYMRVNGIGLNVNDASESEQSALVEAEAALEVAKQADPEAWIAVQKDRAEAIARADNN